MLQILLILPTFAETFAKILKPFETFADTIVIAELFLMLRLWILLNLVLFLKLSIYDLTIFLQFTTSRFIFLIRKGNLRMVYHPEIHFLSFRLGLKITVFFIYARLITVITKNEICCSTFINGITKILIKTHFSNYQAIK